MINRISEIPFWGPEEQIRRFVNQHDEISSELDKALRKLGYADSLDGKTLSWKKTQVINRIKGLAPSGSTEKQIQAYYEQHVREYIDPIYLSENSTQQTVTQQRIENLDDIFQKQLIWSYGRPRVDDAYFYQDWCPIGTGSIPSGESVSLDPKWQMEQWGESIENQVRDIDRTFNWREFQGYTNSRTRNEMVQHYGADSDFHAEDRDSAEDVATLDINTLRHNIMRSYLEVSEWLGDAALQYGSQNGYVSRKMSLAWLFNAIKALINWKLANQDKYAEATINPLVVDGSLNADAKQIRERFLRIGEASTQGIEYEDELDLDQQGGRCAAQPNCRANDPQHDGTLKVRGNEWHYGERADFYTHNSFMGECRFFHNARFLGQTTFDKEINGTALRARWADLAEFKEADRDYDPGTLVMFGGEKEITLSRKGKCNAVVTTKPGLVLNGDNYPGKIMVGIALTGTVPVKVVDKVRKFDRLVASSKYPGYARKKKWWEFWKKPIAIALESGAPFGDFVNCITKMEF